MRILLLFLKMSIFFFCSIAYSSGDYYEYLYELGETKNGNHIITVHVKENRFSKEDFSIHYCSNSGEKLIQTKNMVCAINDVMPFGLGGAEPDKIAYSYVSELFIRVGSETYALNVDGMYDAILPARFDMKFADMYKPNINKLDNFSAICIDDRNCVLRGNFSDGCCSYYAEWVISSGRVFRSMIFQSNDAVIDRGDIGEIFSRPNHGLKLSDFK